ncbi:MAG TPA: MBL fold metallo-hydrolase [Pseudorhodoplanes sp.]|jgi:phosphoribosyl 1,2-cyclic phosphate phosphodiesterase|nr:MBL fold metallo-hydrolase [Pseudorhodoplanes sp.]
MTLTFTILGCGSSAGVPRPALGWGACDPANPRNRRRRCSLLVERRSPSGGRTRVLVDTSPDLREQLIDAGVEWLDGVLFTHEHADHTHGIDDLRSLFIHRRRRIDVYLDSKTSGMMHARFSYCFISAPGSDYPPILTENQIAPMQPVTVDGEGGPITALPVPLRHGSISALGFRFGNVFYSPDISGIPDESLEALLGLDVWIVDALRYAPHPSHFSFSEAVEAVRRLGARRAILTHLHADLDYEAMRAKLPTHIEPAYDGLTFDAA